MRISRRDPGADIPGFSAFERTFWYPFGKRRFRIDHGKDSLRFFGPDSARFVALEDGRVVGTLALSPSRRYLGDLKILPSARGSTTLARLARAAMNAFPDIGSAYAVVMDGTEVTPDAYSGRAGFPAMKPLARFTVLRVEGAAPSNAGCARITHTRDSKRLYWDDGTEMLNAHLKGPATPESILDAAGLAAHEGFPALLAAVPEDVAADVAGRLAPLSVSLAGATVYGFGWADGTEWVIGTAEV